MAEEMKQDVPPAAQPQAQPQAAPAGAQSTAPVKKSGGAATVIIIVLVVLVALGVGGYFVSKFVVQKSAEKLTEGFLGAATGGNVDITNGGQGVDYSNEDSSLSIGQSAQWPSDMPTSVPEFTYGTPIMSSKLSEGSWSVLFEEVSADAQTKYTADLDAQGWVPEGESIDAGVAQIIQMTNGNYILSVAFDRTSKGATLTVSPKAE